MQMAGVAWRTAFFLAGCSPAPAPQAAPNASPPPVHEGSAPPPTPSVEQLVSWMSVVRSQVQQCYETELKQDLVAGTVLLAVQLAKNGAVQEVQVLADETGAEVLVACLSRLLLEQRYPRELPEPLFLEVPFEFSPVLVED